MMEYDMFDSLNIAKSGVRRDLLSLFFTNPEQKYYLRQLERLLGYSAGNIRRELLRLLGDRLFKTEKVGNLLFYSLNINHPLYEELKSIIFKTIGVEGSLRNALSTMKNIKTAFICGSFASKNEKKDSDIDVMIIGDPEISELNGIIRELEKKLKREINPTVYSLREYRAKKKDKRGFILELLKSPKMMLIGSENDL
jgi:predicted nucleotidyltransferase